MQHSETVLRGNSTVGLKLKTMHNVRTFLAFKIPFSEPEIPNPLNSDPPSLPFPYKDSKSLTT